jgi:hypothetical protein
LVFSFAEQLIAGIRAATIGSGKYRLIRRWAVAALAWAVVGAAHATEAADPDDLLPGGIFGDIMDTAVDHCRRGESAQALSMFAAMRQQLNPPPAILRLIQDLEAHGCRRPAWGNGSALRLRAGPGWDSNVSQGINARSLVIGSGPNELELELDESYRPRSTAFVQALVDYTVSLPSSGVNLHAGLGLRKNARESAFDLATFSAAASREFHLQSSSLRPQVEVSEVWLGDRRYLSSRSAALQWLKEEKDGSWLATVTTSRIDYRTQPAQNARQWEAGLLREQRIDPAHAVFVGLSLQKDEAAGARPGGDRAGFQLQLGTVVLAAGWRHKAQLSYTSWTSEEVFAPGLLDVRRRNRLRQVLLQAEKPLSPRTSLVLEWRGRWASDPIPLYRYRSQVLSGTLVHQF